MDSKSLHELVHEVVNKWNTPPEILVIDDDINLVEVFAESLRRLGIAPSLATDGTEAERIYRSKMKEDFSDRGSSQHPFDLVFLDLRMPAKMGVEVLSALRKLWPIQPIVIISGYIEFTHNHEITDHGPVSIMCKPISFNDIRDCILMHNIRMKNNGMVSAPPFPVD